MKRLVLWPIKQTTFHLFLLSTLLDDEENDLGPRLGTYRWEFGRREGKYLCVRERKTERVSESSLRVFFRSLAYQRYNTSIPSFHSSTLPPHPFCPITYWVPSLSVRYKASGSLQPKRAIDCLVSLPLSVAKCIRFPLKRPTQAIKRGRLRHVAFASLSSFLPLLPLSSCHGWSFCLSAIIYEWDECTREWWCQVSFHDGRQVTVTNYSGV